MLTVTIELKGQKQTFTLKQGTTVIGRSRSADIRLHHPSISSRHARIEVAEDGGAKVVDAGSKHGLLSGNVRVGELAVTDGLAVTIGKARLSFQTGGGQARAESLRWSQLPDPGASGISPPPAPGSGLGTTPCLASAKAASPGSPRVPRSTAKSRGPTPLRQQLFNGASSAAALAVSIGLHGFLVLVLTVAVYKKISPAGPHPTTVNLAPPKSLFKMPDRPSPRDGDGSGRPDATVEFADTPRPRFADTSASDPDLDLPAADASLDDPTPSPAAPPPRTASVRPPISLDRRAALKKIVKVELVPDDGSWEKRQAGRLPGGGSPDGAPGGADSGGLEIGEGADPAELVRGNMGNRPGGWKTIAQMEPGELGVVSGDYDCIQRVMDTLKIPYTLIDASKLGGAKLSRVKCLLLNCPGTFDGSGILKLRSYVEKGGWVVSTDWALSPIKEAFPGYLRNVTTSPETWVGIEAAAGAENDALLRDVFNFKGEKPKWYLEERSYLFKVDKKSEDKVKVLVHSPEMEKKWGTGCVAATFDYGKGKVLHIASHLKQKSTDPKAHYAMYQFFVNWLEQAANGAVVAPADDKRK
jgi:hypothetical protein